MSATQTTVSVRAKPRADEEGHVGSVGGFEEQTDPLTISEDTGRQGSGVSPELGGASRNEQSPGTP